MSEKGTLRISYKRNGKPEEFDVQAPLGAGEAAVLHHVLNRNESQRVLVDVDWNATGVARLRPQVEALGITDVEWEYL
ncbi:hypothetical protein L3X14_05835 [Pseudomonas balearica]|uniref:hypothetical protein n=1 Tax=Stutzerimonas balearica TaxID=74829 RepID=UPI001F2B248E|nr:hypothetical protein [Stutzerimonas balearica]MCF6756111.1 hypothetical protein [Stutzerimonas balearica]